MALGFLERTEDRYANTPGDRTFFLDRTKPSYIGGILEMANHRLYPFWGHLTEALRTGQPQNEMKTGGGASLFEALYADPARLHQFLSRDDRNQPRGQSSDRAKFPVEAITARSWTWAPHRVTSPFRSRSRTRTCGAVGFDLPEVAPIFDEYVAAVGVEDRLTFAAWQLL